MNSCFQNIVGISRTGNTCFTDDFNADAAKSVSGLYIDEVEGFPTLDIFKAVAVNEQKTLQNLLVKAREDAIEYFFEKLYQEMGARYTIKAVSYNDFVGQKSNNGDLAVNNTLSGMVWDMKQFRGATVTVEGTLPQFNYTGSLEVKVYKAYSNGTKYQFVEQVASFTVNAHATNPVYQEITPFTLENTDELGKAYSYLFLVELADGQLPKDNSTTCGCGGKENILNQYLTPKGITGSSIDDMLVANKNDKVYGLLMKVKARCSGGDFVCDNYYNDEFIRKAIDWAILRKAASSAMVRILTSDLINRYTMAKREQMGVTINILNNKTNVSITWVAENISLANNDCFTCYPGGNDTNFQTARDGILL